MDFLYTPQEDRPSSIWQPPAPRPADDFIADVKVTAEAFEAGRDAALFIDNTAAGVYAREEAIDRRNAAIKRATGVALPNPFREAGDLADVIGGMGADPVARYQEQLRQLAESHIEDPAALAAIQADRPIEEDVRGLVQSADLRASEALGAASSRPWLKWGGYFAGAMWGGLRDPVNLALLFAGGGPATARTATGAVLKTALREGVINAGGEALTQPVIQKWRGEMGLESGLGPAAENVAMAFGLGALVGGGVEGVRQAVRSGRAAAPDAPAAAAAAAPAPEEPVIARALAGDEDALIAAAREGRDALDPATIAAADALEADRLARAAAPPGVPPADHEAAVAQAVRHAEDPDEPPPVPPAPIAPARADAPSLADDVAPPAPLGRSFDYLGRRVTFEAQDAAKLGTDATAFQYKGGGDAGGVTERLRSVTRWDNLASGKVVVFERADGSRVIADGHQRLGLARRLLAEGAERDITLDAYVFREADGWTPAEVRAVAAKKNLQEGSGDVIDTARILRERPDLLDGSVPTSSDQMRRARALARLSDDAWSMVLNRQVAPQHAAAVGELVQDPAMHAPIMGELAKVDDLSARQARLLVADLLSVPARREVQETLFGTLDAMVPLIAERSKVLDAALSSLKKSKGLFRTLVANADTIERAGNQLAVSANLTAAEQAERAAALLEMAAHRHGPVSQALDRAALAMSEGRSLAQVRDAFTAEVIDLADRHGLVALATMEAHPPRLDFDAPAGPEAQKQIEDLTLSLDLSAPEKPPPAQLPETRGGGIQYHGSSSPDLALDDSHSSTLNYYGQGFYSTDALDVAAGYPRSRGAEGALYQVLPRRPLRILDGEARLAPDLVDRFRQISDDIIEQSLDEQPESLRALYDLVRDNGTAEGLPASEIQEIFGSMRFYLEQAGYDGFSHAGGLRTKTAAHRVVIYFDPEQKISLLRLADPYQVRAAIRDTAELIQGQPHETLDDLYAAAPRHQAELGAAGKEIAAELGTKFKDPGLKKRPTTEEKMVRKGYLSVRQLTDVVRGGVVVETPEQAEAFVTRLRQRFDVLDEGWNQIAESGYVDRKLLVRFDDGTVGEVQMWEKHMLAAKDVGTALYTEARSLPPDDPRRAELMAKQQEIYSAALRDASGDWTAAISAGKGGSSPKEGSNAARSAASELSPTERPVDQTSIASTADQGLPGASTANALEPSEATTAGRTSQFTKDQRIGETSEATLGLDNPESNVPVAKNADGIDTQTRSRDAVALEADRASDVAEGVAGCKPLRGPNGNQ